VLMCVSFVSSAGSSADTLSGWAEHLNALYKEIGGCLPLFVLFCISCLTLLVLHFLVGRACEHFKKVDYHQLLRYNLEQQCLVSVVVLLVCFASCYFSLLLTHAFAESLYGGGPQGTIFTGDHGS
jgi:hypothetical protein